MARNLNLRCLNVLYRSKLDRLNCFARKEDLRHCLVVDSLLCGLGMPETLALVKLNDHLRDLCDGATLVLFEASIYSL